MYQTKIAIIYKFHKEKCGPGCGLSRFGFSSKIRSEQRTFSVQNMSTNFPAAWFGKNLHTSKTKSAIFNYFFDSFLEQTY